MNAPLDSAGRTVVFLDRDGTINRNFPDGPVYQPERFELLPRAAEAIRILNDLGVKVLVVTNQGGIRHVERNFDWDTYHTIERMMIDGLRQACDARVDGIYVCPHACYEDCGCRKPRTGLFDRAAEDHPFDAAASYMVGDSADDIVAGAGVGLRTILVESGWDKQAVDRLREMDLRPDWTVPDLYEAVLLIGAQLAGSMEINPP